MLSITIYSNSSLTRQLADYTNRAARANGGGGLNFSSGTRGFAACELPFIPMALEAAFDVLNWPGVPHMVVGDNKGGVIWEGRIENRQLLQGGISLTAYGYARAMSDTPYTALISDTNYQHWRVGDPNDWSVLLPERWQNSIKNDGLYVAPRKGEDFSTSQRFAWYYDAPDDADRGIYRVDFDYELTASSSWQARLDSSAGVAAWTLTGDGATQSGSATITLLGESTYARFIYYYNNATPAEFTGETGDNYFIVSNIRVKGSSTATITANAILPYLISFVNGVNGDQLDSRTIQLDSTTDDLNDELYNDDLPAKILDRLALSHGYEWGVFNDQIVHFRSFGSWGKIFYSEAISLSLDSDLSNHINSAYAVYKNKAGQRVVTAVSDNSEDQEIYKITRRAALDVQSTDSTQASNQLTTYLADRKGETLRAAIQFDRLYDLAHNRRGLSDLRAGDTVIIRNLPGTLGSDIDNIRSFVVGRATYQADPESLTVEPVTPIPTLAVMLAKNSKNI